MKHITPKSRALIVGISLSAAFLSVLTQFLLITAYPRIMDEFSINASEVQWLTTGYMLALAVFTPLSAYFIDKFKTRPLMMAAMSLFILGTLLGLFAPTFEVLLAGRIIQGLSSGIMMPLMQTLLFLVYPRERRGYAMGLAGLVINVAPAVGPPISGILINHFAWRSLFIFILPIAGIILLLIFLYMRNVTEQRETSIDFFSIILSTIGFGGILYGFTTMQTPGVTDSSTILIIIAGFLSLLWFVIRQFRLKTPILELRVFKVGMFTIVVLISILSFSLLIATETILPMYIQNAQELSALHAGLVAAPGALTLAFMSMVAGNLYDKYGGKNIAIIGFILLASSTLSYYFILGLDTSLILTAVIFMIAMAGVALINMPVMTAGINALPDELVAHGTAIINTARQFGGSIGLTFIISFISNVAVSDTADAIDFLIGVKHAFFVSFLFAITGLILALCLREDRR
jgi:EmrB/QacA subfamily drug resistance transporter